MTYNEETTLGITAILAAFLGLGLIGSGIGGVASGDMTGWLGAGLGSLLCLYAGLALMYFHKEENS